MNRILLLLLIIVAGCIKHDVNPISDPCTAVLNDTFESCSTIQTVTRDKCIIKEASISGKDGVLVERFVYHYNGTNYDTIYSHYKEYNTTPTSLNAAEMLALTYRNGAIYKARFFSSINDKTGIMRPQYQLTFNYADSRLNTVFISLNPDGTTGDFTYDYDTFYSSSPRDSIYFFQGPPNTGTDSRRLFDYKGKNFIREGVVSDKGFCSLHDANWLFAKNYYDEFPNVLKDYAVRFPISNGKSLYGYMSDYYVEINTNNLIAQTYNDGITDDKRQYCWTFLKNGSQNYWVKKFTVLTGATITYQYDCE